MSWFIQMLIYGVENTFLLAQLTFEPPNLGCVYAYFAKAESAFWNADLKRWFKTLFIGVLFMLNFLRARESMLRNTRWWSRAWFQGREPERRIWRHINAFKCEFAFMLPQKPWFGRNADRKRTFLCVLKRRFETAFISKWAWTQPRFELNAYQNADFGLKKWSINAA